MNKKAKGKANGIHYSLHSLRFWGEEKREQEEGEFSKGRASNPCLIYGREIDWIRARFPREHSAFIAAIKGGRTAEIKGGRIAKIKADCTIIYDSRTAARGHGILGVWSAFIADHTSTEFEADCWSFNVDCTVQLMQTVQQQWPRISRQICGHAFREGKQR